MKLTDHLKHPTLVLVAAVAFCQDVAKKTPKPFKDPPVSELTDPALVARDEGCAKDLAKSRAAGRHRANQIHS